MNNTKAEAGKYSGLCFFAYIDLNIYLYRSSLLVLAVDVGKGHVGQSN